MSIDHGRTDRSPRPDVAATASRGRAVLGLAAVVVALVLAGCSSNNGFAAPGESTTTRVPAASGTTSTTAGRATPGTSSPGASTSGTSTSAASSPRGTATDDPLAGSGLDESIPNADLEVTNDARDVTWALNASQYREEEYGRIAFECGPGGEPGPVWGTTTYTDDSSVCTAAVHAGLIGFDGGRVVIEVRPGLDEYAGSDANGITSEGYGPWPGSFVFPGA